MAKDKDTRIRFLIENDILYNNSVVCVLNNEGRALFQGMAWEMDDDVLDMHLNHILSVYSNKPDCVFIESTDRDLMLKPEICVRYNPEEEGCKGCECDKMACWVRRHKSSHGGFVHEEAPKYGSAD